MSVPVIARQSVCIISESLEPRKLLMSECRLSVSAGSSLRVQIVVCRAALSDDETMTPFHLRCGLLESACGMICS